MDFKQLAAQYKNELFENVLPFWLHRSQDFEQGGYYTCLNREVKYSIRINLSGFKAVKFGYFPCFIIKWKSRKSGWIVQFKVVNS